MNDEEKEHILDDIANQGNDNDDKMRLSSTGFQTPTNTPPNVLKSYDNEETATTILTGESPTQIIEECSSGYESSIAENKNNDVKSPNASENEFTINDEKSEGTLSDIVKDISREATPESRLGNLSSNDELTPTQIVQQLKQRDSNSSSDSSSNRNGTPDFVISQHPAPVHDV
jgi:hypothetical protein